MVKWQLLPPRCTFFVNFKVSLLCSGQEWLTFHDDSHLHLLKALSSLDVRLIPVELRCFYVEQHCFVRSFVPRPIIPRHPGYQVSHTLFCTPNVNDVSKDSPGFLFVPFGADSRVDRNVLVEVVSITGVLFS